MYIQEYQRSQLNLIARIFSKSEARFALPMNNRYKWQKILTKKKWWTQLSYLSQHLDRSRPNCRWDGCRRWWACSNTFLYWPWSCFRCSLHEINEISSSCSNGWLDVGGHLTMSFVCEGSVQGDGAAFESHVLEKLMNRGILKWEKKRIICIHIHDGTAIATQGSIAHHRTARAAARVHVISYHNHI